jgi:hypothetical protein
MPSGVFHRRLRPRMHVEFFVNDFQV